jgi:hypothetical protein
MASYKNRTRTRKRSKKTYRKKYRKTASKRMMGGGFNPFSTLFTGISGNFSLFKSNAKQEAASIYNTSKTKAQGKIAEAKTQIANTKNALADRAKCIAACASAK